MQKSVLGLLVCLTACLVGGTIKVDIDGRNNGIVLTDAVKADDFIMGYHPSWAAEAKDSYYCYENTTLSTDWTLCKIGFTPNISGKVTVSLRSGYIPVPDAHWTAYDKFSIKGATPAVPNLDLSFEKPEAIRNGHIKASSRNCGYASAATDAPDGKAYVLGSHNASWQFELAVTQHVPVIISFMARYDRKTAQQSHPLSIDFQQDLQNNKWYVKRDLSKAATIRIEIDTRQFGSKLIKHSASEGLVIQQDEARGIEKSSFYEVVGNKPLTNEWQDYSFQFQLDRPTSTYVNFRSLAADGDEQWVAYDDVRVETTGYTRFSNGTFASGNTDGFSFWKSNGYNARINVADAAVGKNYALASAQHPFQMTLYPFYLTTVKFKAKNGGSGNANGPAVLSEEKPVSYYRLYNKLAKYLPLKDKGINPKTIGRERPNVKPSPKRYPVYAIPEATNAPKVERVSVPIELLEESGIERDAWIRVGIPFAQGQFMNVNTLRICSSTGSEIPAQFSVTSWWPDKSIKTALAEFSLHLTAGEKIIVTAVGGSQVPPKVPMAPSPLRIQEKPEALFVNTGILQASIGKEHFALLSDIECEGRKIGSFIPEGAILTDENGRQYTLSAKAPKRFAIELDGAMHKVIRVDGAYTDAAGTELATYTARLGFYAGSSKVDIALSLYNTNLSAEFSDYRSLKVRFVPASKAISMSMGTHTAKRIFQHNDMILQADTIITDGPQSRLEGGGDIQLEKGSISFSIKDMWRRYPKAVDISDGTLSFELLPNLPDSLFGTDLFWYLQFPFCEGNYRLKWGMGFTEEITIDFAGKASGQVLEATEIIPVIDRDWLSETAVWEGTLPKANQAFDGWDKQMLTSFKGFMNAKERQREYGFLNYGDSYGERGRNWNNNEYDTANCLFMLFLRTGDRSVARYSYAVARHQADVDIVHAYPDPYYIGANAQHGIGHTGVSYQVVNPATWTYKYDAAYVGTNGHTWSEGMLHTWMYHGDAVTMDSALMLGNHLIDYVAPGFTALGTHERSAGWSVRAILAYYRATSDKRYLDAARRVVDIALAEQKFDKGGAWPHTMPGDHSGGVKDAFGNCPYLMGILSEMLRQYYRIDPRSEVKRSLISVARWLKSVYDPAVVGWPYGASWDSKPFHAPGSGCNGLITPGMLIGGRLSGDKEIYHIGCDVVMSSLFRGASGSPKGFSMDTCYNAAIIEELCAFAKDYPDIKPFTGNTSEFMLLMANNIKPDFQTRGPEDKEFRIVLKDTHATMKLERKRHGSRPQGEKTFQFHIKDANGKVIFTGDGETNQNKTFDIPLSGTIGDELKLFIHDDMAGIWNIDTNAAFDAFSVVLPGYYCGNGNIAQRYITVPKDVETFSIDFMAVHEGGIAVYLYDEHDVCLGKANGMNPGGARFPWLAEQNKDIPDPTRTLSITVPKAQQDRVFRLIIATRGNMALQLKGIPPVLSTSKVAYKR